MKEILTIKEVFSVVSKQIVTIRHSNASSKNHEYLSKLYKFCEILDLNFVVELPNVVFQKHPL